MKTFEEYIKNNKHYGEAYNELRDDYIDHLHDTIYNLTEDDYCDCVNQILPEGMINNIDEIDEFGLDISNNDIFIGFIDGYIENEYLDEVKEKYEELDKMLENYFFGEDEDEEEEE